MPDDKHGHVPALYDQGVDGAGIAGDHLTKMDAMFLFPHKGWGENVRLRVFPMEGRPFDVFIDADRMRAALDKVAPRDR